MAYLAAGGLSAYCIWVRRMMRRWSVQRTLSAKERVKLTAEANRLLTYTESFPYALKAQAARRAELHSAFDKVLRKALAAQGYPDPLKHGVYLECFPNECAVAAYVRRSATRVKAERNARTKAFVERVQQHAGTV